MDGHQPFEFSEVDDDVGFFEPADDPADDLAGAVLEFIVDHLLLGLAQALHHRLLGRLGRDPPEVARSDINLDLVARLHIRLDPPRHFDWQLFPFVGDALDHERLGEHPISPWSGSMSTRISRNGPRRFLAADSSARETASITLSRLIPFSFSK